VIENRAAYVRDTPNANDPADVPPGTVGPHTTGDVTGVELLAVDPPFDPDGPPFSPPRAQPWDGWPTAWATPNWWGRFNVLSDIAWACLDLNSSVLAAMPPYLIGASDSLPRDWINNPDPDVYSCWCEFVRALAWDFQGCGEAFVLATARYANGFPARFHVVSPWLVNVEMDAGFRRYFIGELEVTGDILHIAYMVCAEEARGHGPLEAGRARLIAAEMLLRYSSSVAQSGGIPNSVLVHPQRLNAKQAEDLQAHWVQARMSSMGLPAVLSGGVDFRTLSFSPKDAALIELAQMSESRIAILLRVPPFLVGLPAGGDSLTYSNVNSIFDYHWRAGLKPMASRLMEALSGWLLPRGTTVELNRDEYIRPGPLERAQTYAIEIPLGILTVEQAQEIERTSLAAPTQTLTSGVLQ